MFRYEKKEIEVGQRIGRDYAVPKQGIGEEEDHGLAMDKAMYTLSIVLRAISERSFAAQ
jgi:hypothetical protein